MYCIYLKNKDPFFCLAAEEYLMKKKSDDIFMIWQSNNTVVVGKHQNAMAEINYPFIHKNNINVARRISGGGTVFHDKGNVNFSFIKNVNSPSEINFKHFVQPIINALGSLNIMAVTSGRNDILVQGKKISGNAEHIFKNRVLHHGTLLFDSDLELLSRSIKVVPGKYYGKAVQSNRSAVTNIIPYLKNNWTVDDFSLFLLDYQLKIPGNTNYRLSEEDNLAIQKLVSEKFNTWDWNFGYSPKYIFKNETRIDGKRINVKLQVEKGHISDSEITGEFFTAAQSSRLTMTLKGARHFHDILRDTLSKTNIRITDELVFSFF
jgi:lipoate---protein ligase